MASLLLTLAGLFGMHGLGNHGTDTRRGHAATSATPTATGPDAMPGMDAAAALSNTTYAAATVAHDSVAGVVAPVATLEAAAPWEPTGGGMLMGAAGMCMAVLLLSLIALAVVLHAGRLRPIKVLTASPSPVPPSPGRDADPPSLFVLSIQRC